jgi:hypothetical protein
MTNPDRHYRIVAGKLYALAQKPVEGATLNKKTWEWEDPRTAETEWPLVQARRNALLSATDWVTARAYEKGEPVPQNYAVYRQALRDITNQPDPFNIT